MEKIKKLVLKKETLIALQENQLRGITGGMAAMSVGAAAEKQTEFTMDSCILTCQPPPQSCCKKTCNGSA